jgi:hypothetical protein
MINTREERHLLRSVALNHLPCLKNAYVIVEGASIAVYGEMKKLQNKPGVFTFHTAIRIRYLQAATGRSLFIRSMAFPTPKLHKRTVAFWLWWLR